MKESLNVLIFRCMVSDIISLWASRESLFHADSCPWEPTWDPRSSRRQTVVSCPALAAGSLSCPHWHRGRHSCPDGWKPASVSRSTRLSHWVTWDQVPNLFKPLRPHLQVNIPPPPTTVVQSIRCDQSTSVRGCRLKAPPPHVSRGDGCV